MPATDFYTDLTSDALRWPIVSLDFEASGLGNGTYPIEAGVAVWPGPDKPIEVWSTLIAPADVWSASGHWDPASEPIHNIPRADLAQGMAPADVLDELHRLIGVGGTAFCDGGRYDGYWLSRLASAAEADPLFFLVPWKTLHAALSFEQLKLLHEYAGEQDVPHRAGPDAALNIQAYAHALGLGKPEVIQG
jgi:hypothetical protein